MKKMDIQEQETKDFFVNAFINKDLIPILGAGFSCGMQARGKHKVPSGKKLKSDMIEMVLSERKEFTKESLEKKDFSWVAEKFLACDLEKVTNYFYQHFAGINFTGENKKKFLNEIDWNYIYTLNIDTAIENSANHWEVFYPNEKFVDKTVYDKKKLFKIHGDINLFCKTKNVDKLILSQSQYLKSLRTNSLFHDMLSADCAGHNLLYIGCSLDDEIDIKYTVISDLERCIDTSKARKIYVTFDDIENDPMKLDDLKSFNITHYIKLEDATDYELFYEFIWECYNESLKKVSTPYDDYSVRKIEMLEDDREKNLEYLLNLKSTPTLCKPYYFFKKSNFNIDNLKTDKINIFIGRRYSGKTLFIYELIDDFKDRKRYFISSNETISDKNIAGLLQEENALIVMDANSVSDTQLSFICSKFDKNKNNIVCMIVNRFDEIANNIPYFKEVLEENTLKFEGRLTKKEIEIINKKLDEIGISIFDDKQTILDNTLRIGTELDRDSLSEYKINSKKELELLIWIAVNKKIYLEQIMTLSLYNEYTHIVKKYTPILEIEKNNGERFEHSPIKIVCNAPIALLQILNNYAYPPKTRIGGQIKNEHFQNICAAIYHILFVYEKIDQEQVKKFLLFDVLNDVFSRQYSKENIDKLVKQKKKSEIEKSGIESHRTFGAAALIQAIYEDTDIQKLKSSEPNYWLQRAKGLYILNSGKNCNLDRLKEGIDWAKKAKTDSEILVSNGKYKYYRTMSNAIMQIAMLYGKLAYKSYYKDYEINTHAVYYYYEGFSDENNLPAAQSLMERGRGTADFKKLLNHIRWNKNIIFQEELEKAEYLCNISEYSNGVVYHLK